MLDKLPFASALREHADPAVRLRAVAVLAPESPALAAARSAVKSARRIDGTRA